MPGYQKVKRGSYLLEDWITRKELKRTSPFNVCFRPGRQVLMSMRFYHTRHEKSSCPSCHAVNPEWGRSDVCCSICGMQYRRIIEVLEEDEEPPSVRSSTGPKIPAEAVPADEDITEFKRIQIVAPRDFTRPFDKKRSSRISNLARHFEQLSRKFEKDRQRERRARAARGSYSRAFPLPSSKPIVEVYRNVKEAVEER
ncbi:uncharacterized protein N7482_004244 [Penicillium canariense]|uniref:GATA-type domain-containing protein n=1 Tax=Penicillium canariense TaxID=189055 RepID=A0A9W9I8S8_9EURO|nr:uncharacterized protein N7482_004244 [Penicillium canariense]KAJ5168650.1 hypothetical protein N7482_004244 [Penicillium canariense]